MIDTKTARENKKPRRMTPGIHTACTLSKAELKTTTSGKELLEIWFKNPQGDIQKKTIWVADANPTPRDGESLTQAKEREINRMTSQILDITDSLDISDISGKTIEEFVENTISTLNKHIGKGKCNLIVILDKNEEYTEFPRYDWIQPHIEGTPARFNIRPEYKFEKQGSSTPVRDEDNRYI